MVWTYVPGANTGLGAAGDNRRANLKPPTCEVGGDTTGSGSIPTADVKVTIPWHNPKPLNATTWVRGKGPPTSVTPNFDFRPEIMSKHIGADGLAVSMPCKQAAHVAVADVTLAKKDQDVAIASAAADIDALYRRLNMPQPPAITSSYPLNMRSHRGHAAAGLLSSLSGLSIKHAEAGVNGTQSVQKNGLLKPKHASTVTRRTCKEPWRPEHGVGTGMTPWRPPASGNLPSSVGRRAWVPSGSEFLEKLARSQHTGAGKEHLSEAVNATAKAAAATHSTPQGKLVKKKKCRAATKVGGQRAGRGGRLAKQAVVGSVRQHANHHGNASAHVFSAVPPAGAGAVAADAEDVVAVGGCQPASAQVTTASDGWQPAGVLFSLGQWHPPAPGEQHVAAVASAGRGAPLTLHVRPPVPPPLPRMLDFSSMRGQIDAHSGGEECQPPRTSDCKAELQPPPPHKLAVPAVGLSAPPAMQQPGQSAQAMGVWMPPLAYPGKQDAMLRSSEWRSLLQTNAVTAAAAMRPTSRQSLLPVDDGVMPEPAVLAGASATLVSDEQLEQPMLVPASKELQHANPQAEPPTVNEGLEQVVQQQTTSTSECVPHVIVVPSTLRQLEGPGVRNRLNVPVNLATSRQVQSSQAGASAVHEGLMMEGPPSARTPAPQPALQSSIQNLLVEPLLLSAEASFDNRTDASSSAVRASPAVGMSSVAKGADIALELSLGLSPMLPTSVSGTSIDSIGELWELEQLVEEQHQKV